MKKIKGKKDNDVNFDVLSPADLEKYLQWKATQLTVLGYKLNACIEALKKYVSFPNAIEVKNNIIESYTSLMERVNKFRQDTGLSEKEAKEYIFCLEATNDDKSPIALVARHKTTEHEVCMQDHLNRIEEILKTTKIPERQSLTALCQCCTLLGLQYMIKRDDVQKKDMRQFARIEHDLRDVSCEALGYWSAKLEMMKQNKNNVKMRTTKKDDRKTELKEWMKTMKAKEYRLKAMQKWDVTERTVLHYEQEIRGEKTPIMRKKGDNA